MQLVLSLCNVKCVETAMQAAQAMSVSVPLPQSGNPFLKKADTSLIRLSDEPREEEDPPRCTPAVPRLGSGLQPLGSLACSTDDLALAKSL